MGININAGFEWLITSNHSYKAYEGKKILMLGVQDVELEQVEFEYVAKRVDFELICTNCTNKEKFSKLTSYRLFKLIGFSVVEAIDYSDYEGAEIIQDLNYEVSSELYNRYDYIYDGGTLEHIFNLPVALKNINCMLKTGGVVIHDVPVANWCDHGFYSFSPTLFYDYYKACKYRINELRIFCKTYDGTVQYNSPDCRLIDSQKYIKEKLDLSKEVGLLVCVATKREDSTNSAIPIQSFYEATYSSATNFENELNYSIEYVLKKKYKRIAIYGAGNIAKKLFLMFENKGVRVEGFIRGIWENDNAGDVMEIDISDANDECDCIIIGSFAYADEIEKRLSNCNCAVINMRKI